MKKLSFIVFLSITILLCAIDAPEALAADVVERGICGDDLIWTLDSDGLLTVSGTGDMYDYQGFGAPWYDLHDSITSVVIGEGVTSIGYCAFYYCTNVASVTFSDTVERIKYMAFWACFDISSIDIPDNVEYIGSEALGLNNLESVYIPKNVSYLAHDAFDSCNELTAINVDTGNIRYSSIDGVLFNKAQTELIFCPYKKEGEFFIPYGVTAIGSLAFAHCNSLTSVNIPESVTQIGEKAFQDCCNLSVISIPSMVTEIGLGAFWGCEDLAEINVDQNNALFSSENGVLFNKDKNELICCPPGKTGDYVVPSNVTVISDWAFRACENLTSVTIPDGVTIIGEMAFDGCYDLSYLTLPDSITSIGDQAFAETSLTHLTLPANITSIGRAAFGYCEYLSEIVIPENVTSIGDMAFCGCQSLTRVTIPASVTNIGEWAFYWCDNLTDVFYYGSREQWDSIGFDSDNDPLLNATIHYNTIYDPCVLTLEEYTEGDAIINGIENGGSYSGETAFTVACDDACVVLCTTDGGNTYLRLTASAGNKGYKFTIDVTQDMTIVVALKGDVNLDGVLKNQDVTMAKAANLGKRTLSTLQEMVADVTGDGIFKNQDITKFKAALLGKTDLSWDIK